MGGEAKDMATAVMAGLAEVAEVIMTEVVMTKAMMSVRRKVYKSLIGMGKVVERFEIICRLLDYQQILVCN